MKEGLAASDPLFGSGMENGHCRASSFCKWNLERGAPGVCVVPRSPLDALSFLEPQHKKVIVSKKLTGQLTFVMAHSLERRALQG